MLQFLKLMPENVKIGRIYEKADTDEDWRLAMREVRSLFRTLGKCPLYASWLSVPEVLEMAAGKSSRF